MADSRPWFKFFADRWLSSELYVETDLLVHGLFFDVISQMWTSSRCAISESMVRSLCRKNFPRCEIDAEADLVAETVLGELVPHHDPGADGLLTHPLLLDLWLDANQRSPAARGSTGGKKRASTARRAPDGSFLPASSKPKLMPSEPKQEGEGEVEEEVEKKKRGSRTFGPEALAELIRTILPEIPKTRKPLQPGVKKKIAAAIKRERKTPEEWKAWIEAIRRMPFLLGKNNRGWTPDVVWLLGPENGAKIDAGRYLDKRKGPTRRTAEDYSDWGGPVFDTDTGERLDRGPGKDEIR